VDLQAELVAPCTPEVLFGWVSDLERYPSWLEIVPRATAADDGSWAVDLRGKLGPLARTKRLRMVRTVLDAPHRATFERAELDGRQHSPWRLVATVEPVEAGARLQMSLHYGGGLFQPVVDRLLRDEIERSRVRLLALVAPSGSAPTAP
jgi:hypothetical protein